MQATAANRIFERDTIQFTNTSTSSCALRGCPGVSVLDTAHHQIGPAATRTNEKYSTVKLTSAQTVTAVVRTANGPIGGPCNPDGTYLRVYPPASYTAVHIPAPLRVCSHIFTISPVTTRTTF